MCLNEEYSIFRLGHAFVWHVYY